MNLQFGTRFYLFIVAIIALSFSLKHNPTPYVFPAPKYFPAIPNNPDNPVTVEGVDLGRHFFYDPILSADSTMSCASCHKQENAFSDAGIAFSKGIKGELMTRNTMALFNLAWYPSFFWDGRVTSLEEQPYHPVRTSTEMNLKWKEAVMRVNGSAFYRKKIKLAFGNSKADSVIITKAIAQFLRTLISYESKFDKVLRKEDKLSPDELEGFEIVNDMTRAGCLHCHTTDQDPMGTIFDFSNNGLDKALSIADYKDGGRGVVTGKKGDYGKFKIPSIRNLLFTAPYMHDGRFKTIEEVVNFYSEGLHASINVDPRMEFAARGGPKLNEHEKRKVIAFLKTLSDSVFIKKPEFGNPFIRR